MSRAIAIASVCSLVAACGGDGVAPSPTTTTTGATTSSGSGGAGGSQGVGGAGAMGGAGTSVGGAGGTGGSGGFPWEGAIDPNGDPSSTRLTAHPLGSTSAPQGFYEYVPSGYPGTVSWPLLVALHGIGENGNGTTDLADILVTGVPEVIDDDAWPIERPFVVLMPQHEGGGCPSAAEVEAFIAWGIDNYAIDPAYVYLTGLSCGAIGGWSYLAQNLDSQIAAFVPISGDGKNAFSSAGCDLAKVGIWAFHGDADTTVNVSGTNQPMDELANCPSPPALETKKTIYPGVGHNAWDRTYDLSEGHDIYSWMLGFTNPP